MRGRRIINVSNRLPVKIGESMEKSTGGLVSALEGLAVQTEFLWVGWAGQVVERLADRRRITRELREKYRFYTIFLSREEVEGYYDGFANSSLWPLVHYMAVYTHYDERWYPIYVQVNERFARTVAEIARDGDIVWIHDYHLMLLPSLLRERCPKLKIGYFLHTPFPSSEVFRCHPRRKELLKGLLGADLIGFHTFGYLRHFRSSVLRLLGIESEMDRIQHRGRVTRIGVYPIGINWKNFETTLRSSRYRRHFREYKKSYQNKRMVLSVERLDYTKGIPRKIQAIEKFLRAYPKERDRTVFIIIAVPSREEVDRYQELKQTVELAVSRVNGEYSSISNIPLHFINRKLDFIELCTLYSLADVAMVTPLMDGMNLVAKEYIACQIQKNGVLVLSEFAGSAQELFSATMVNPYAVDEVAEAVYKALNLSEKQKRSAIKPMRERIIQNDAFYWTNRFIDDLTQMSLSQWQIVPLKPLNQISLNVFQMPRKKKALFLDYDGTIRDFETNPADAIPSERLKGIFMAFEKKNDLDVYILSGRKREFLEEHIGEYNFTLIAEHGYFYRRQKEKWKRPHININMNWKKKVIEIFRLYSLSTPGSSVEEKHSSLVWHYRKADPEFGAWKASELLGELTEAISNLPVEIHQGKMIVEVRSQQVSKGASMLSLIQGKRYSFILCAGDDQTDESMFKCSIPNLISVKIGEGNTAATYQCPSVDEFLYFLESIYR